MMKIVVMVTKRRDLSDAEFRKRYLEGQGPLVARFPGLRKYVQNPVVTSSEAGVSGVAELWFDDVEAWDRARASPEFLAAGKNLTTFAEHTVSLVVDEVSVSLPEAAT